MSAIAQTTGDDLSHLSGFNTGWLKDEESLSVTLAKRKNKIRLKSVDHVMPNANRNISSIVSRIRDEGAAFSHTETQTETINKKSSADDTDDKKRTDKAISDSIMPMVDSVEDDKVTLSATSERTSETDQKKSQSKPDNFSKPSFSAVCDQVVELDENLLKEKTRQAEVSYLNKKPWHLIVGVCVIMILVLVYISYQFKVQSDEMKQTLHKYQQVMNENKLAKEKQVATKKAVLINKKETAFKPPVSVAADEEKNNTVISQPDIAPNIILKQDKAVKEALSDQPLAKEKKPEDTIIVTDKPLMFSVNLASFSEREKAIKQLSFFQSFGVNPVIEQATVGSKIVYRLCVEGFSSREEAGWFIARLNKKHAVNAWVRPI